MSVQQTNEQNYWKAYCQIIKQKIAPQLGPDSALFFCTESVRCIPAADFIPAEVTNLGLFFLADSLLDATNLFYVPGTSDGFIKSVQTYLSFVDLGGSEDQGVIARYIQAQQDLANAQAGMNKALTSALSDWQNQKSAGLTTSDFPSWASSNAALYNDAVIVYQGIAGAFKNRVADMNGELAPQYNQDTDRINSALYSQTPIPGITMAVTNADNNQLSSQLGQALSGNPPTLTPPAGVYYKGAYSLPNYASTLKTWCDNFPNNKKNPQRSSVTLDAGRNTSLHEFGFTDTSGSIGFGPFCSFGSFNSHDTRDVLKIDNAETDIQMTLTYGDIQAFPINPGNWNIGNPKSTYPKLHDDAPPSVKNLVKPVQILCGTAIGLEVKFSGNTLSTFDSMYTHFQQTGAGLRIFGINIGIGTQTTSDTAVTHQATWDGNSGTLSVKPVDAAGWCTLLGVLGEKLK